MKTYMGQLHTWSLRHAAHPHWDHADAIACDEELAYAIALDDWDRAVAADLKVGDVIRIAEGEFWVITSITPVVRKPGEVHAYEIGTDCGPIYAYPGRPFQVYA